MRRRRSGGRARVAARVVVGGREEVASYLTWSGAVLCCIGLAGHRHHPSVDHAIGAVPLLAVGTGWRPSTEPMRRVLVGLGGGWPRLEELAVAASSLAALLDVELAMIEVAEPDRPALDVPVSAHLRWVSDDLPRPVGWFDTVVARRTDSAWPATSTRGPWWSWATRRASPGWPDGCCARRRARW